MKYIDIHAHLTWPDYDIDREEVIKRAYDLGVAIINIGTDIKSSEGILALADQYRSVHPHIYSIPGIHPHRVHERYEEILGFPFTTEAFATAEKDIVKEITTYSEQIEKEIDVMLKELSVLAKHPTVVGIGECGIDTFRLDPASVPHILKLQEQLFVGQIKIALEHNKPIMVHARESYTEILSILDEHFISKGVSLRGNVHFFAGSSEDARMFLERGLTVSFTGVITFAKVYEKVVAELGLDQMMSETDCPFVSPVPHRGRRNEPSYVIEVVKKIAQIRGEDEEAVRNQLLTNAERYFDLNLKD